MKRGHLGVPAKDADILMIPIILKSLIAVLNLGDKIDG